jgi:hypothetical protein
MGVETLMDLVNEDQTDIFVAAWNEKYSETFGRVRKKFHDHDFGAYCSVVIKDTKYWEGLDKDIEDVATQLADDLKLEY